MSDPETGPSGFLDMSDLRPRARIQPQMVPRQEPNEVEAQARKLSARRRDLQPVNIPLDIYLVILEHSSGVTLRNFCLVSKLSYHYAFPLLWRNVKLSLKEANPSEFTNALRDITKRHGRHVETIDLGFLWEERYDDSYSVRPIEVLTNGLVELAVEKMPKLRSVIWGGGQTPSNDVLDALKKLPCLTEFQLDSDNWNMSLVTELNFSGFRHLTSFIMDNICDDSQVLAIRHILDTSTALKKLHFKFADYFWEDREQEASVDVFDILFSKENPRNGDGPAPGKSLEEFTMIHGLFDEHDFGPSFFRAAGLCFKNLDSLTLHHFRTDEVLTLGRPGTLRLRKLRLQCHSWKTFQPLLEESKNLELLYIQITHAGFNYDELVPLICLSKDTLKDLRLERDGFRENSALETMCKDDVWNLASNCSKIRELSLRADFDMDGWRHIEDFFPVSFVDLTHFKLQGTISRGKPPRQPANSNGSSGSGNAKDATDAKQLLSIKFIIGADSENKYPENTAGDFFAAFITAANDPPFPSDDNVTKLKYVGIDGDVYELHVSDGRFTYSKVPKELVERCGGPFVPIKHIDKSLEVFRLASID